MAVALTEKDALGAHARDEIGVTEIAQAKPFEAAIASAIAFIIGGVVPILGLFIFPSFNLVYALMGLTIAGLVLLGIASARLGGAPVVPAVTRVVVWGTLAMIATSLIGRFFGVEV